MDSKIMEENKDGLKLGEYYVVNGYTNCGKSIYSQEFLDTNCGKSIRSQEFLDKKELEMKRVSEISARVEAEAKSTGGFGDSKDG